jgi:hypothetical protein
MTIFIYQSHYTAWRYAICVDITTQKQATSLAICAAGIVKK